MILLGIIAVVVVVNFGMVYIRALVSGAKVTFTELIALRAEFRLV